MKWKYLKTLCVVQSVDKKSALLYSSRTLKIDWYLWGERLEITSTLKSLHENEMLASEGINSKNFSIKVIGIIIVKIDFQVYLLSMNEIYLKIRLMNKTSYTFGLYLFLFTLSSQFIFFNAVFYFVNHLRIPNRKIPYTWNFGK